ncbi:MAG: hypothetical protein GKS00_17960 [Alphaproteobacteria bacterium]|nr:hypothetical protein [Alphaproteobacteria bacterium]
MLVKAIREALGAQGLILRGGFHPGPDDDAPPGTETLLLIGNAGPALWRVFESAQPTGQDSLNYWTKDILTAIAAQFVATAVYPFEGPPYAPFFAWAKRAEPVHPSPLGMLIHPSFGLWHAWRGALAFPERLELPPLEPAPSPCDGCSDRPCLTACPVDAFSNGVYDVEACAGHLRTDEGADCMALGCRARRACPVGMDYVYEPEQAVFHMTAFLRDRPS